MENKFAKGLRLALAPLLIIMATGFNRKHVPTRLRKENNIISCGAASGPVAVGENGKYIPVLPGWGHHSYTISTTSDSAQVYFNQGISFYFGYHLREALASFKEAARFDTACVMAYWGQALAMGPYYNNYYYKMKKEVPGTIGTMIGHLASTTFEKEKALVAAMQQRYSADTSNSDRPKLDSTYAVAMSVLAEKYPADADISALYVDAMMLSHKWDFWNNDGSPKSWTPQLVSICESILQQDPHHPAALHYYIHLTEASNHPEIALHSADVLKEEMPGVGHMVHMATHMYQRNGLFAKGVYVNEDANTVNNLIDSLAPNLGLGKNNSLHIYAVQSYCAMNAGMYSKGMPVYLRARQRLLELRSGIEKDAYAQYVFMMPVIALARLGRFREILQSPAPDKSWKYALVLDDFAKGLAHVHDKNITAAKECLARMQQNLQDSLLSIREVPFNKPVQCANIAAGILKGAMLFGEDRTDEALAAFSAAVKEEDLLIYREPQEWLIPARQYLGASLLKLGKWQEAEKVYRDDLIANPGNGWSLRGMYNAVLAQNKITASKKIKAAYIKAFEAADVIPDSSVF